MAIHYAYDIPGGNCGPLGAYDYNNGNSDVYGEDNDRQQHDYSRGFHRFGLDWHHDYVKFYVDDKLVATFTDLERNPGIYPPYDDCTTSPTQPVTKLDEFMWVVLWNWLGYQGKRGVIEPREEAFEVDYFNYYKRKPIITLDAFSCVNPNLTTYTYKVETGIPGETYTWYPPAIATNVTYLGGNNEYISFQVDPADLPATLKVTAERTLQREIGGGSTTPEIISSTSSIKC